MRKSLAQLHSQDMSKVVEKYRYLFGKAPDMEEILKLCVDLYNEKNKINTRYKDWSDSKGYDEVSIRHIACDVLDNCKSDILIANGLSERDASGDIEHLKDELAGMIENRVEMSNKEEIYIFEPHPDDAVGSASGLCYCDRAAVTVHTLALTKPIRDNVRLNEINDRERYKEVRKKSSIVRHVRSQIKDFHWDHRLRDSDLDFGKLASHYKELYGKENLNTLSRKIKDAVKCLGKDSYIAFPLGIEHPMHILTSCLCVEHIAAAGIDTEKIIIYIDHPYDVNAVESNMIWNARKYIGETLGISLARYDSSICQHEVENIIKEVYGEDGLGDFNGALSKSNCSFLIKEEAADKIKQFMPDISIYNVLYVTAQAWPFYKTGGSGEIAYQYAKAASNFVNDIRIMMPKYKEVTIPKQAIQMHDEMDNPYEYNLLETAHECIVEEWKYEGIIYYLVDIEGIFEELNPFYSANQGKNFAVFCDVVLECALNEITFTPNILHCNDWQTGLIPFLKKTKYRKYMPDLKTVYTIHFYGYQGIFSKDDFFSWIGFDRKKCELCVSCVACPYDRLNYLSEKTQNELHILPNQMSCMKAGINFADVVSTVSSGYAKELQRYPAFSDIKVVGIRNGVTRKMGILNRDEGFEEWYVDFAYENLNDADTMKKIVKKINRIKPKNKEALQKKSGLRVSADTPLICMVSRLTSVKGIDEVKLILEEILKLDVQLIIVGDQDDNSSDYTTPFHILMKNRPGKFVYKPYNTGKEEETIQREFETYAGSDILLMPSRAEACGTTQINAMIYGTIPIVSKIDSFSDTVVDGLSESTIDKGVGFYTYKEKCWTLLEVIKQVVKLYTGNKPEWSKMVNKCAMTRFGWEHNIMKEYLDMYAGLFNK